MDERCPCCGGTERVSERVLWPELVRAWRLAPHEVAYVDRQQGTRCAACGCNLRSMALAAAIAGWLDEPVPLVAALARAPAALRVLEVNEAGGLTPFLARVPGHVLGRYPEMDLRALPYPSASFDLVVHSDTLEHVEHPRAALAECRRVLRPGGACAFTVPIIVDRLTASRHGLEPSHHGNPALPPDPGMRVHTEYGADAWKDVVLAGFRECRLVAWEYPAAIALVGSA
jgi:SAM-dependent methyltransferase